jgi:isoamyl acetate esterase
MRASLHIRPAIVLFGDSITQQGFGVDGKVGWASLLAAAYTRRADVLNRGFSGYNTQHALDLVPRLFGAPPNNLLFCTVFLGANDAALPGEPQHVPIDQYAENLKSIITSIRECSQSSSKPFPVILLTPPPVDEAAWAAWKNVAVCDRSNQVARAYGARAQQVATELDCPVVDTWTLLEGFSDKRGEFLSDGLHLNEQGNRRVFEGLMTLLQQQFPDLAPMGDDDGDGKHGKKGIPVEEKLWKELCGLT